MRITPAQWQHRQRQHTAAADRATAQPKPTQGQGALCSAHSRLFCFSSPPTSCPHDVAAACMWQRHWRRHSKKCSTTRCLATLARTWHQHTLPAADLTTALWIAGVSGRPTQNMPPRAPQSRCCRQLPSCLCGFPCAARVECSAWKRTGSCRQMSQHLGKAMQRSTKTHVAPPPPKRHSSSAFGGPHAGRTTAPTTATKRKGCERQGGCRGCHYHLLLTACP
jgi:hypothetical protein